MDYSHCHPSKQKLYTKVICIFVWSFCYRLVYNFVNFKTKCWEAKFCREINVTETDRF